MALSFSSLTSRSSLSALSALALIGATGVLYQNCTEGAITEQPSLSEQAAKLGFAYSARFDQIAYMSCSNLDAARLTEDAAKIYFSLRAGGYRSGGIGIQPTFFSATRNMSVDQRSTILSMSPLNSGSTLQLALRQYGSVQQIFAGNPTTPVLGRDYTNFFTELGDSDISSRLQSVAPNPIRVASSGDLGSGRFEASLHFGFGTTLAQNMRNALQGSSFSQHLLALTYAGTSNGGGTSAFYAKSPGDGNQATNTLPNPIASNRFAFGRGYLMSFATPEGVVNNAATVGAIGAESLAGVSEVNLETRAAPADSVGWTCPSYFQLRIVRRQDAGYTDSSKTAFKAGNCIMDADPAVLSDDLAALRRSFPVEHWYIDLPNRCIVPKLDTRVTSLGANGTDCYGAATAVQYNLNGACGTAYSIPCTAFASVCYRNR